LSPLGLVEIRSDTYKCFVPLYYAMKYQLIIAKLHGNFIFYQFAKLQ